MHGGQFNWGGFLLKDNEGVQKYPQPGWKSGIEYNGIRMLYCKDYNPSSRESGT